MSLTPAFRYISAAELAAIIKANPAGVGKTWAVIDVRDSDFVVSRWEHRTEDRPRGVRNGRG
jgi:hypothetical protein